VIAGSERPLAKHPHDAFLPSNVFGSYHPGGCQFGMVDGSVRFVNLQVTNETLARLAARDDGRVVTLD
jgi:prepilin-type processing-associated H-X9-DG protein